MRTTRIVSALLMLAALGACGDRDSVAKGIAAAAKDKGTGGRSQTTQSFELTIDGKVHHMAVDTPSQGHLAGANLVQNRMLTISAMDQKANFMMAVTVAAKPGGALVPGTYESYQCRSEHGCDEARPEGGFPDASIMPFPDGTQPPPSALKHAFKGPKIGLQPLIVTLSSVQDAHWEGVGPAKRVKGSFKGSLASVEVDKAGVPHVVGALKQVEGKFDMYSTSHH